jgi:hypothetical protein
MTAGVPCAEEFFAYGGALPSWPLHRKDAGRRCCRHTVGDERGVNIMGTGGVIDQSHGGAADREDVRNDTSASQSLA